MSNLRLALFIHMASVFLWTGCVIVKEIYEHCVDKNPGVRDFVSQRHWTTDKYVEIPACIMVLLTGGYMLTSIPITPLLATKIGLGVLAIFINAVCIVLVIKRLRLTKSRDYAAWERMDRLHHRLRGLAAVVMVLALFIGGNLYAGF